MKLTKYCQNTRWWIYNRTKSLSEGALVTWMTSIMHRHQALSQSMCSSRATRLSRLARRWLEFIISGVRLGIICLILNITIWIRSSFLRLTTNDQTLSASWIQESQPLTRSIRTSIHPSVGSRSPTCRRHLCRRGLLSLQTFWTSTMGLLNKLLKTKAIWGSAKTKAFNWDGSPTLIRINQLCLLMYY